MQPPVRLLREGNASDRERNADESRQIRQRPAESMSLGRIFRFREGMALSIRMNFQNIFYSTQLSNPTATNPLVAMTCTGGGSGPVCANPPTAGKLTGGFGFVNYVGGSTFLPPRLGMLEMRLQF